MRPQPIAPAFSDTAGTAGTLVGGRLGDRHHVQTWKAGVRIEARFARQPRIDHHAHAGQRDRGLGHIGRQHDAASALAGGLQNRVLRFDGKFAVQHEQFGIQPGGFQRTQGFADFALARQEDQDIARMRGERGFDRAAQM